jgi:transcriptional regulator with XRE-family HTH domain
MTLFADTIPMPDRKEYEKSLVREIAGRITAIKKARGISQADFTRIVTQQRFSSWNVKGVEPGVLKIHEISKLLNVTMDFLVTGKEHSGIPQVEQDLLEAFNHLNETGKKAAIDAVRGLYASFPQPFEQAGESSRTAT